MRLINLKLLALLATGLLSGCGTGVYKVEGRVVWPNGAPATELNNSIILFENAAANTSAQGQIKPDGSFTLTTNTPDDGALPGEHRVAIIEVGRKPLGGPDASLMAPGAMDARFSDPNTSGLTAKVEPGVNKITLTVERAAPANEK
jgi:hypothetical protein